MAQRSGFFETQCRFLNSTYYVVSPSRGFTEPVVVVAPTYVIAYISQVIFTYTVNCL